MKKKILILGFLAGALTFTLTKTLNAKEKPSLPGTPGGVSCKCKIAGGACKANGWGSTCTTVTEKCWEYNSNC